MAVLSVRSVLRVCLSVLLVCLCLYVSVSLSLCLLCSGLLWTALVWSGLLGSALLCSALLCPGLAWPGLVWSALVCSGLLWSALSISVLIRRGWQCRFGSRTIRAGGAVASPASQDGPSHRLQWRIGSPARGQGGRDRGEHELEVLRIRHRQLETQVRHSAVLWRRRVRTIQEASLVPIHLGPLNVMATYRGGSCGRASLTLTWARHGKP